MEEVSARACVCVHIYGLFYQLIIGVNFLTQYNILWEMIISSCFIVTYSHIFTMFLVFLCFSLTVMPGELTPFPKPHPALPTNMRGYVVDTAISNQPIQIQDTAI